MVGPAHRRDAVGWAQAAYQISERRACHALLVHRALVRYQSIKPDDAPVRRRLHELALARPSFGLKRLHIMLRRDGLPIIHKKTRRLYVEEGLRAVLPRQVVGRSPFSRNRRVSKVTVNGSRAIVARIKSTGEMRVSSDGVGALTREGVVSGKRELTHLSDLTSAQLTDLINLARQFISDATK